MSYPTRPPLGIPMPGMAYMSITAPPPLMPAVMPVQHMMPVQVTSAPQIRALPRLNPNREQLKQIQGPPVTVFVGNITEKAPDTMIRQILGTCGHVISWKRVKAFGFCELAGPEAGLRAVRLLHDMMVGDKRLVAKVDAKTKIVLDEYKAERRRKERGERGSSPLQDEPQDEEQLDDETLALDAVAVERIKQILVDHEEEMNNFELKKEEEVLEKRHKVLEEAEVEEEKRDLITREIGKFREIMKKQEEEKEVSRRKEKEKPGSRSPSPRRREKEEKKPRRRSRSRSKDDRNKEVDRADREREKEREREREREQRDRDREIRERERDRDRDRDRERERDRGDRGDRNDRNDRGDRGDREDRDKTKNSKELLKDKEIEEEMKEKKKAERRAREKEAAYQERLRTWETRERRKAKDYEKDREKDRIKEEERERDAKRLKEFLEDYDDERDDIKLYKGSQLQKRITERFKEFEADNRDRQKEKEEIEELKAKIFSGGHEDPNAEFERVKREREEQYKPKLIIDVNLDQYRQREKEREREIERQKARDRERDREAERELTRQRIKEERERCVVEQAAQELAAVHAEPIDSDSDVDGHHSPPMPPEPDTSSESRGESVKWTQIQAGDEDSRQSVISNPEELVAPPTSTGIKLTLSKPSGLHSPPRNDKRRRADLREVFNPDEDDTSTLVKKRKLVPLDYTEEKKSKRDKENGDKKSEEVLKSQEEKRKHIKSLIEKIPTEKNALFDYQLDWTVIDNALMEKKIRPWINKKIIEYIGEPEPTLVDFICSKVLAGSQPQVILEDVQMVLDEEAEVFVVKMWRLLIYEVEAKKLGLVK